MSLPAAQLDFPLSPPSLMYGVALVPDEPSKVKELQEVLSFLHERNVRSLDTARQYGTAEGAIGNSGISERFKITTKAFPTGPITPSAMESLKRLKREKVGIYLIHAPDEKTPAEIMKEIQQPYDQGRFEKWGVSNFSASQIRELHNYAKSQGHVLPTVYQANYNLLARKNETLLFPTLRELGITNQAYSPAAGGFLLKSYDQLNQAVESRWATDGIVSQVYRTMYNKPLMVEYSKLFGDLAERSGVG